MKYTNSFRDKEFTFNGYTNTIRFCGGDYMAARKLTDHWVCDHDTSIPEKDMLRLFSLIHKNRALNFGSGEELVSALAAERKQLTNRP